MGIDLKKKTLLFFSLFCFNFVNLLSLILTLISFFSFLLFISSLSKEMLINFEIKHQSYQIR